MRHGGADPARVDVLVVGAGPTGLTLACDLIRRGQRVRIIDAAPEGFTGSRAKGLQPRTLEVFEDLGVLDDVQAHATRYPKLGIHFGPLTVPRTMIRRYPASEDVPYPDTLLVAQYDTDSCLRRRLLALGGGVEFGTRLLSFAEDGRYVTAAVASPAGEERIACRFLVGADGGASAVRKAAGIEFVGATDESDRMILADVRVEGLPRDRWHMWPRRAGRFTGLCPLPNGELFQLMIRLRRGEEPALDFASLAERVRDVTGLHLTEVAWTSVWRPNVRLAGRYRAGRILLAGDAAHVHTPAGAQGLNTGVQDAYNLGWKLGQVLAGAPDSLLETYESERRPVAAQVLGRSSELYANIADRPRAAIARGDTERQLTLSYRDGPLALDTLPPTAGRSVRAGDRAPDIRCTDAKGHSHRLFERTGGPHFTLLQIGSTDHAPAPIRWPGRGAQLNTVPIDPDQTPGIRSIYGLDGPAQVLVRPDGYIAHLAPPGDTEALSASARQMAPPLSL